MPATWRYALLYLVTVNVTVSGGCGEPGWLPTLDIWTRARVQRGDDAGGHYRHLSWIAGASVGWATRTRTEAGTRWVFRGTADPLMRTGGNWSADGEWVIPGHTGPMSISAHDGAPQRAPHDRTPGDRGDPGDRSDQASQGDPMLEEEPGEGLP